MPWSNCTSRVNRYPNHLWHTDLSVVPTSLGFGTTWLPFTLPQCWPFAWWIGLAEDHFSRRVMGYAVFPKERSSAQVCTILGRAVAAAGKAPRHIVCDRGPQFDCEGFRGWCRRKNIRPPRYGAIGKHGSLAVIERLILTLKVMFGWLPSISLRKDVFYREIGRTIEWYNEHRPHTTLGGGRPDEAYFHKRPANRSPRFEPRALWPRSALCALPQVLFKGRPGVPMSSRSGVRPERDLGRVLSWFARRFSASLPARFPFESCW
jgi:transposase InsO family protein